MATSTGYIDYDEGAAPATPAAATVRLYSKADGLLYSKDDAGAETLVSGGAGGGAVATDTIWDAAGDLAVGSGADTAARLAKGAAGANLSTYNGVVAWNGGTAFPATPATGDRYWRSDLGMECYYDGTRWLTTQQFTLTNQQQALAADVSAYFPLKSTYQVYLTTWDVLSYVSTATTWVVTLQTFDTELDGLVTLDSVSTVAQNSAEFYITTRALDDVVDTTAAHGANLVRGIRVFYDEQAGTSTFFGGVSIHYRLIVT